jgi:hypothetical protein
VFGFPEATVTRGGFVELATSTEVTDAFNDGVVGVSTSGYPLVVPLAEMTSLKAAVLSEIRLLEKKYTYFYIDGTVDRPTWDSTTVGNIPEKIYEDILWETKRGNIHELQNKNWTADNPSSEAQALAAKLVFKDLGQAMKFIDNRDPIGTNRIVFFFYGGSEATLQTTYEGRAECYFQRGPSEPPDADGRAPAIYLAGRAIYLPNAPVGGFIDLHINGSARANPTTRWARAVLIDLGTVNTSKGTITTWNCKLVFNTVLNNASFVMRGFRYLPFSRTWVGNAASRLPDSNIDITHNAETLAGRAVVNWNTTFWGKECEVFTRRGGDNIDGGEPEAGERTFTLNVTDERPSNSTENRHSYTVFRVDDSFRYIAGAYNANVGGTTIYGMDWSINFTNYRGGTFFFVTQQEAFGPLSIQMGQSLFPEDSEVWVEAPNKKTNFTFTEDESSPGHRISGSLTADLPSPPT